MRGLRFTISKQYVAGVTDKAYMDDGEAPTTELLLAEAWETLQVAVEITVGGVTMHAAAWGDPDHWEQEWAEKLGVDGGDVAGAVAELLAGAVEE